MSEISQLVNEALLEPSTADTRITQAVIEPLEVPSTANIRITQAVIEFIIVPSTAKTRVTQMVIELPYARAGLGLPFWVETDLVTSNPCASWTDEDLW